MNVDLTFIQGIVGLALMVFNIFWIYRFSRGIDDRIEDLIYRAKTFYAAEKKDIVEGIPVLLSQTLGNSLKMRNLGQLSGLSRQMKGLEKDLIAEGVNATTGMDIGPYLAKYVQKYPFLMQLLPLLAKQKMQVNPRSSSRGELGRIG